MYIILFWKVMYKLQKKGSELYPILRSYLAEKERFSRLRRPLALHSRIASKIIFSQHSLLWLLRFVKTSHRDVFTCSPLPIPSLLRIQISYSGKKKSRHKVCFLFLAEKERFELSRRVYPAYTLSRGASSAS